MPLCNITMVTHNRLRLTRLSLESVLRFTGKDVAVHVVDNGSTDGTPEYLRNLAAGDDRLRVLFLGRNMGVAVAANLGWSLLDAPYYLKLDNDMLIRRPDWLRQLIDVAARNPELALIGYQCCDWHRTSRVTLSGGDLFLESDCCGGACVLVPRTAHERMGFWNEDYGRYGFEDLEYGGRAVQDGWRIGYVDAPGRVEHMGYAEGAVDPEAEAAKRANVASEERGKRLYVLNKFLFEQGIRPLFVARRYLPEPGPDGSVRFRGNPGYRTVLRLHAEYLPLVDFSEDADGVRIDLSRLRRTPEPEV